MTKQIHPSTRVAGLHYLIIIITGFFHLGYVPGKLIDIENANRTAELISDSGLLFRFGIIAGLACYISFIFLVLELYKILSPVHEQRARLMVALVLVSVPIACLNIQNLVSMIRMVEQKNPQQALEYYRNYLDGLKVAQIFWGLWLLPFGWLVFRSGFLPKFMGVLLMVGYAGYLINFIGKFLSEEYAGSRLPFFVGLPASVGEIGVCLVLLLKRRASLLPRGREIQ